MTDLSRDRRSHPRIVLDSPASLVFDGHGPFEIEGSDLSLAGLGFKAPAGLAAALQAQVAHAPEARPHCKVQMTLPVGYERPQLEATGRLAWLGPVSGESFNGGLEFLGFPDADKAYLEQMVEEAIADAAEAIRQLTS